MNRRRVKIKKLLFCIFYIYILLLLFSCSFNEKSITSTSSIIQHKVVEKDGIIIPITESSVTVNDIPSNSKVYLINTNPTNANITSDKVKYISNSQRAVTTLNEKTDPEYWKTETNQNNDINGFYRIDDPLITELNKKTPELIEKTENFNSRNVVEKNIYASTISIGTSKTFNTLGLNDSNIPITATVRAITDNCIVWVDNERFSDSGGANIITTNQAQKLAEKFSYIYPYVTKVFGSKYSVSKNTTYYINPQSRISILIYDINRDYSETQTGGVFGYFNSLDFYINESLATGNKYSNQDEIFYVDANFYNKAEKQMYSTLVHEFQHMLNFVHKHLYNNKDYETWYTEMLSMLCEDVMQDKLGISDRDSPKSRFIDFNISYYTTGLEEWLSGDRVYDSYAMAYAFGAYLARNYGGVELIKKIATNNSTNAESITAALNSLGYSETFDSVFKAFGQACISASLRNTKGLTFRKTVTEIIDSTTFTFSAFDIMSDEYFYNSIRGPLIFSAKESGNKDIKAWGFVLREVGTYSGTQTFNIGNYSGSSDYSYLYIK